MSIITLSQNVATKVLPKLLYFIKHNKTIHTS